MKITIYAAVLFIFLLGLFFTWLTKPYMDYQSVRVSDKPEKIIAQYVSMSGDPLCSKFYEVMDDKVSKRAIIPNVPEDLPDPHDISELKEGNQITLIGYRYEWQAKNIVTGKVIKKPIGMMDVIAWNSNELKFESKIKNLNTENFKRENYTDCR